MRWILIVALLAFGGQALADEVFVGAGDIAVCNRSNDEATASLLDGIPGTVFTLGDNAYPKGTAEQFDNCYEPSWGRHKARTRPAIGNHEYMTAGAQGYLDYFGVAKNYAFDLGDWHIISLDSMCQLPENGGSCAPSSPTMTWLKSELSLNPKECTLVYFHHPRWSSGRHGNTTRMSGAWKIMYAAGVDVVLSAHDHSYERFAPLNPEGNVDMQRGIRSFVVGTGGGLLSSFIGTPKPGSQVRNASAFGVLKLTLRADDFAWEFVPVTGGTFTDSGSGSCH
jgi:hypothetical protein